MDTLIHAPNGCNISTSERPERAVLQEQLRHWRNLQKQAGNVVAQIEKRLADIERATVERERAEVAA
jgi:hypothetical protein